MFAFFNKLLGSVKKTEISNIAKGNAQNYDKQQLEQQKQQLAKECDALWDKFDFFAEEGRKYLAQAQEHDDLFIDSDEYAVKKSHLDAMKIIQKSLASISNQRYTIAQEAISKTTAIYECDKKLSDGNSQALKILQQEYEASIADSIKRRDNKPMALDKIIKENEQMLSQMTKQTIAPKQGVAAKQSNIVYTL